MSSAVTFLRLEYADSPFIAVARPRVSWKVVTAATDWSQTSAELLWTSDGSETAVTLEGADSVLVPWPFAPISPRQRGVLRVRAVGSDGEATGWSTAIDVVGGWLDEGEWQAGFVGLDAPEAFAQPALVRGEFDVDGEVRAATSVVTWMTRYWYEVQPGLSTWSSTSTPLSRAW